MKNRLIVLLLTISTVSISQSYEIYISDAGNFNNPPWQILKFDGNGENPSVFINSHLNWPQDILFMEDSAFVLISNLGSGNIHRHDLLTGDYLSVFASSISGPTRTKIGPDGLLYVLQWSGNGKVLRYQLDGTFVDEFTSIGVPQSIGLDWDSDGNLYVSSYNGKSVRKFDTEGNDMGLFINANLLGPTNIWFEDNGDLLVADYNGTAVKRFNADGEYQGDFLSGLGNCEGVDFYPNGDILIGNGASSSVKKYNSNGEYLEDFIENGAGNLLTPNAVRLRSVNSSSTLNQEKEVLNLVYPTTGTEFFINEAYVSKIDSLQVFNIKGEFIEKMETINSPAIKAHTYAKGIYLVHLMFKDGTKSTEQIIMKQ